MNKFTSTSYIGVQRWRHYYYTDADFASGPAFKNLRQYISDVFIYRNMYVVVGKSTFDSLYIGEKEEPVLRGGLRDGVNRLYYISVVTANRDEYLIYAASEVM